MKIITNLVKKLMFGTPVKGTPIGEAKDVWGRPKISSTSYPKELPRMSENEWYQYIHTQLTGSRENK
jgi:hypothetical protein